MENPEPGMKKTEGPGYNGPVKAIHRVGRGTSPPRLNPNHTHEWWELVLYSRGKGQVLAGGREYLSLIHI